MFCWIFWRLNAAGLATGRVSFIHWFVEVVHPPSEKKLVY